MRRHVIDARPAIGLARVGVPAYQWATEHGTTSPRNPREFGLCRVGRRSTAAAHVTLRNCRALPSSLDCGEATVRVPPLPQLGGQPGVDRGRPRLPDRSSGSTSPRWNFCSRLGPKSPRGSPSQQMERFSSWFALAVGEKLAPVGAELASGRHVSVEGLARNPELGAEFADLRVGSPHGGGGQT